MLTELGGMLDSTSPAASYEDYVAAAVDWNAMHKHTATTRRKTLRHLRELYSLSPTVPVFAAMRAVWYAESDGKPVLAALCATARDPVMRSTFETVVSLERCQPTTAWALSEAVSDAFPGHYGGTVIGRIGRNLASSWSQAGLLSGHSRKVRAQPVATPTNTAYALYLGHLCGAAGDTLFSTIWARMLGRPVSELRALAGLAARQGWLEYRQSGGTTELTFRHFVSLSGVHLR